MINNNTYSRYNIRHSCKKCKNDLDDVFRMDKEGFIYCTRCLNQNEIVITKNVEYMEQSNLMQVVHNHFSNKPKCVSCKDNVTKICFSCLEENKIQMLFCNPCHSEHLLNSHDEVYYGDFELERKNFKIDLEKHIDEIKSESEENISRLKKTEHKVNELNINNESKRNDIFDYYDHIEKVFLQNCEEQILEIKNLKSQHLLTHEQKAAFISNTEKKLRNFNNKFGEYISIMNNFANYTNASSDKINKYFEIYPDFKRYHNDLCTSIDIPTERIEKVEIALNDRGIKNSLTIKRIDLNI
jgi:hypothetical protein